MIVEMMNSFWIRDSIEFHKSDIYSWFTMVVLVNILILVFLFESDGFIFWIGYKVDLFNMIFLLTFR